MTADDGAGLRIRNTVRAVVIDDRSRILLVRWDFPERPALGYPAMSVWGTPGGGIEPGEEIEPALRRELAEELGLDDPAIGPEIWHRRHIIPFLDGRWDGQHDRFFLIETQAFEPAPRLTWEQLHAERLMRIRWWTQEELAAFEPTATELFAPRRLQALVADLLADGVPATPLDTGI
jgi:8-oxo-dGTP pyrophosphatase MutT (NUDIX family)